MDIKKIREEFPVVNNILFLNHAGVSPVSSRVTEAVSKHMQDVSEYGGAHNRLWDQTCQKTRELFAKLIHVPSSEVAIMKNTTEAINVLATGYPWSHGDNLVITNVEYPANAYPWLNQSSRGIEVRYAKERNGKIELEDIFKQVDNHTRIISVSFVEFASGYRNDLKSIGEFCRQKDIAFVVDAIQGLGALEFDATEYQIDAITTGMHKWLLGPCGVGLFYCKKELLEKLQLQYVGADSVTDPDNYLEYHLTLLPDARRLEYAMLNYPGIAGAHAALELVFELGIAQIQIRLKEITAFLISQLQNKGYEIFSPRGENEWSGIVSCSSKKHDSESLRKKLREHEIFTVVRANRLRISPHYYNSEEEMTKVVDILPSH